MAKVVIGDILWGEFKSDAGIRLLSLTLANKRFLACRGSILKQIGGKIDQNTTFFLKGYGNNPELMSCLRELMFNGRELLDDLLIRLNIATRGKAIQTARDFLPFSRDMMKGEYDRLRLEIIDFLKTNITYVFHIRKIRNEIKNRVSNIKFRFVTNHVELYFRIPIKGDEIELVQYLDILNKDEAMKKRNYGCVFNLDVYFPEMIEFWKTAIDVLGQSIRRLTTDLS